LVYYGDVEVKTLLNYLKYSGLNVTIKLNPYHWRLNIAYRQTVDIWEQDALVIELLPITIRLWIDDGSW
jgi:hypothetical protein